MKLRLLLLVSILCCGALVLPPLGTDQLLNAQRVDAGDVPDVEILRPGFRVFDVQNPPQRLVLSAGQEVAIESILIEDRQVRNFETIKYEGRSVREGCADVYVLELEEDLAEIKIDIRGRDATPKAVYEVLFLKDAEVANVFSTSDSVQCRLSVPNESYDRLMVVVAGISAGSEYVLYLNPEKIDIVSVMHTGFAAGNPSTMTVAVQVTGDPAQTYTAQFWIDVPLLHLLWWTGYHGWLDPLRMPLPPGEHTVDLSITPVVDREVDELTIKADLQWHLFSGDEYRQKVVIDHPAGLGDAEVSSLVSRYLPVLKFDSTDNQYFNSESFLPEDVSILLHEGSIRERTGPLTNEMVVDAPSLADLFGYASSAFYIDSPPVGLLPPDYAVDARAHYDAIKDSYPTTIYATAWLDDSNDKVVLQYWMFYYFNDFHNVHEGDWEGFTIILGTGPGYEPELAVYHRHHDATKREWAFVETLQGHPVVYVANGSHASYFRPGETAVSFQGIPTPVYDRHYGDGVWIVPTDVSTSYPNAFRWENTEILPRLNSFDQGVDNIWCVFSGKWGGTYNPIPLSEREITGVDVPVWLNTSPDGPPFNMDGKKWLKPIEWAATDIHNDPVVHWTVLVYINGDNDLERWAIEDLNEMEEVGSSDNVNIIVQIDRIPGDASTTPDWSDTRRYYVLKDNDTGTINSARLDVDPGLGELDMGDPQTLVDFVNWGTDSYPADHYAVVVWNHGSGWYLTQAQYALADNDPLLKGVSFDHTDGSNIGVSNGEWERAIGEISAHLGRNVDLIGFDACLMQMWELAHINRVYGDYMVGSEETEDVCGWSYDLFLEELVSNPDMSASELGTHIVNACFAEENEELATQSVLDLSAISPLSRAVDILAEELMWAVSHGYQSSIESARGSTQRFSKPAHVDLYDFASQITADLSLPSSLRLAAEGVRTAVDNAVFHHDNGGGYERAQGIAIYYPEDSADYDSRYDDLAVADETKWDEFIKGEDYTSDLAVALGIQWLRDHQQTSGDRGYWLYGGSPSVGVTAMCVVALTHAGFDETDPVVEKAVNFILSNVRGDGSIHNISQTYETSMAVVALNAVDPDGDTYGSTIENAKNWLVSARNSDGGWRYTYRYGWSDLSVSQWPALALHAVGYDNTAVWDGLRSFAAARQRGDGEFKYSRSHSQGGGGITCAGLWCYLLHPDADKTDPHVQNGLQWINGHWNMTCNPGYTHGGCSGYYYYYLYSLAKACKFYGQTFIGSHNWYEEISGQLISMQEADGHWQDRTTSEAPYWSTALAVLSLQVGTVPPNTVVIFSLASHADLHIHDPGGSHAGLDYSTDPPTLEVDIPNATFVVEPDGRQVVTIDPLSQVGTYTYILRGTSTGGYEFCIDVFRDGELVDTDCFAGDIEEGTSDGGTAVITMIEGEIGAYPTEPEAYPNMVVMPNLINLPCVPGQTVQSSFSLAETGGEKAIKGLILYPVDLTDGDGHVIPASRIAVNPSAIDSIPAAASLGISVSVDIPPDQAIGDYGGRIIIETLNAGRMAAKIRLSQLPAVVDFDPNTLNLKSKGRRVTCYIELPEGWDPGDIDVGSVMFNEGVTALASPTSLGDYDSDGTPDRMVKFDRQGVIDFLNGADERKIWAGERGAEQPPLADGTEVEVNISGMLLDGTRFGGPDTIRVINPGVGADHGEPLVVFPAPLTSMARISYRLDAEGPVSLRVYDVAGRLVRTLVTGSKGAGRYDATWDRKTDGGRPVGAGVYFIRLEQQGSMHVEKVLVVK